MGYSSLCSSIHRNPSYNHTAGRGGERVCKITPHHMAARWTGERCAQSFDVRGRNASANYCIGFDGEIVGCVDESDRSWCSASGWNDRKAITIEVANESTGGDWPISKKSWDSLVRLCADICRRYGFRLGYTGNSSGSLTEHRMFASTSCPGPYLHARMGELARQVNAMLDSGTAPSAPATGGGSAPSSGGREYTGTGFGGTYRCNCSALNVRSAPSTSASVVAQYKSGQTVVLDDWYTIANGYVWGRYTGASSGKKRYVAVGRATGKPEADDYLVRAGGSSGSSSGSASPSSGSIVVGSKVMVTNPYDENGTHLAVSGTYDVVQVNGDRIVIARNGTVVAACPRKNLSLVSGGGSPRPSSSSGKSWRVGAKVRVTNPYDENGTHLAVSGTYTIMQVNGNRVVIGRNGVVTAACPKSNLALA